MSDGRKLNKIVFTGWYPNGMEPVQNVFFRNLIYAIADQGSSCTVINPVKLTKGVRRALAVPYEEIETTPAGSRVRVLHPRILSASARQLGSFNTGRISEALFERGIIRAYRRLNESFDAAYGHFLLYGGLSAVQIGREAGIPSFFAYGECSYRTEVLDLYGEVVQSQIAGLSGVISVSTKNRRELEEAGIFKGIPTIVAPNAVDMTVFHKLDRQACRQKLGIPQDAFVVGFVGSFIERKGHLRVLEAVNRLENVYAAFAGSGDPAPQGERVVWCNGMNHGEIPVFLNAVDVFCLPTLNEGSCNAVAEALSCGLPVISSALPFNDDVLTTENSIRVDPMDVQAIADAIACLRDAPALREKMGQQALQDAQRLEIGRRASTILKFMETCGQCPEGDRL